MIFGVRLSNLGIAAISILAGLVIWHLLSLSFPPIFLPSPLATWEAAGELIEDGTLWKAILASSLRILAGWVMGVVVGVPVGILMLYVGLFSGGAVVIEGDRADYVNLTNLLLWGPLYLAIVALGASWFAARDLAEV